MEELGAPGQNENIQIGELCLHVTRKSVKNVHLSVHPPDGRVTLVAPLSTRLDVARAYAISKLDWIRAQQRQLETQARETPRQFVGRESHYLWGRRYLLAIQFEDAKPRVLHDHKRITLVVRPGSEGAKRAALMHDWHLSLLHQAVPPLVEKWEKKLDVEVAAYFLQRMKTRWGSCNFGERHIRLNTELVKKPRDLLEYVLVHEMLHLLEPNHSARFVALLDRHFPGWRHARAELNELPLGAEEWRE